MSIQINKSAYEKLIKEDIEWLLSNTKDSLERRHIVEVLNYSPERLYASGSSEIPNDLEEARMTRIRLILSMRLSRRVHCGCVSR